VVVVHDGRSPVEACRVDARLSVEGLSVEGLSVEGASDRSISRSWGGALAVDSVTHVGTLDLDLGDATGAVVLDLALSFDGPDGSVEVANHYRGRIGVG
jgi:hypothetical protein